MVSSTNSFSDIQNHWAKIFVDGLVERAVISGFPDRTFRPNSNLTRAQFAAIVSKAFSVPDKRQYIPFIDVPAVVQPTTAEAHDGGQSTHCVIAEGTC